MIARLHAARKSEDGFSLIELLIVIVVLGILGGIVVFGVGTFRGDSQAAACKADAQTLKVAATAYMAKQGLTQMVAAAPAKMTAAELAVLTTGGYIESIPAELNSATNPSFSITNKGIVDTTNCVGS